MEILPHVLLTAQLQRLGGVGYVVADMLQVCALLGLAAAGRLDALTNVPHEADAQSPDFLGLAWEELTLG